MTIEPKLTAAAVTSTPRTSEHKIDMGLEMLDVNNMDTGRYRRHYRPRRHGQAGHQRFCQVCLSRVRAVIIR